MSIKNVKDPGSAITHFIGTLMALFAATPLLIKAASRPSPIHLISLGIFILSMILLYSASTIYHSIKGTPKVNRILQKLDHMMIYVLIAGTYTPICIIALGGRTGIVLLAFIWALAAIGIIVTGFWVNGPKWLSSVIYIAMGWACVLAFTQLMNTLPPAAFAWLFAGGIIYTIGGVIYALKLPIFNGRHKYFGSHEIFHLFVMGGSLCHFILMYFYIAVMP
ncbi:MAG: hemolysin III family protein [Lachnospiraceae bacterium]|jgi:hemolysin III|nr:hemolysin III family protein [Lachnospiraceae bacterium]